MREKRSLVPGYNFILQETASDVQHLCLFLEACFHCVARAVPGCRPASACAGINSACPPPCVAFLLRQGLTMHIWLPWNSLYDVSLIPGGRGRWTFCSHLEFRVSQGYIQKPCLKIIFQQPMAVNFHRLFIPPFPLACVNEPV